MKKIGKALYRNKYDITFWTYLAFIIVGIAWIMIRLLIFANTPEAESQAIQDTDKNIASNIIETIVSLIPMPFSIVSFYICINIFFGVGMPVYNILIKFDFYSSILEEQSLLGAIISGMELVIILLLIVTVFGFWIFSLCQFRKHSKRNNYKKARIFGWIILIPACFDMFVNVMMTITGIHDLSPVTLISTVVVEIILLVFLFMCLSELKQKYLDE